MLYNNKHNSNDNNYHLCLLPMLSLTPLQPQHAAFLRGKSLISYLSINKQQTDKVNQLVNIVQHLAAKETGVFYGKWWRPKQGLKEK